MVLLGAIDQGTSSSRFHIFEADTGVLVTSHQIELRELFPEAGGVEMDPNELYSTCVECIEHACASLDELGITVDEIKAVGITNQRETTVVWSKTTGEPLHNAIVWLDTRTSDLAKAYVERTPNKWTGLPIHPYFSALKLKWLLETGGEIETALQNGDLLFGTVDSWLMWKLTSGKAHVTDVSNASRTLLFDLHKCKWSTKLCHFFEIPMHILPEICSSSEVYGFLATGILTGVPVAGCLGDQQAALLGHNCLQAGDVKSTYGTGTFVLCNAGTKVVHSKHGLLSTVAFQAAGGMTANHLFNQLQANALGRPIVCAKMAEISGWGAAVAAGIGARQVSLEQFSEYANPQTVRYEPMSTEAVRDAELNRWRDALQRARGWVPGS